MNDFIFYILLYLSGVFISAISQIILKKSAGIQYKNKIKEYLNPKVIIAYTIFFLATLCNVFAYKMVPLSMGPILGATEYIFVAVLSFFILKERINKKKLIGLLTIVGGVIVFSLDFGF